MFVVSWGLVVTRIVLYCIVLWFACLCYFLCSSWVGLFAFVLFVLCGILFAFCLCAAVCLDFD